MHLKRSFILGGLLALCLHLFGQDTTLNQRIRAYAEAHQFNGTILIQQDAAVIYRQSFGIADRRFDVPITNDTKYWIASVTKAFTSVLILQLYEQGKLDLNKTINAYLPKYKGEGGSKVTIHELLDHTSGMKNIDTIHSFENLMRYGLGFFQRPYTPDELVNNFCSDPLDTIPGTRFLYNNGEYMILGKVIEAICGKTYDEVLNERILKPLGMTNSGLLYHNDIIKGLASFYLLRSDTHQLVNNLPAYPEDWYASGAMYSTAGDLLKFSNALFSLKLIHQKTLDLMLTPGLGHYGFGVWVRDTDNFKLKRMERFGRIMGANAALVHFVHEKLTIIILSNTNMTDQSDYALYIGKAILKP